MIDENGFLGGRIEEWIVWHQADNKTLLMQAELLNIECHRFVDAHKVGAFNGRQLTTFVLFVRLLELYQGVLLTARRGMRSVSRIVFRSFIEAYFHFEAIHNDPSYLDDYVNQFEVERKGLINRIRRSKEEMLADLRRPIDDALIAEIESIKRQRIKIEDVARRADRYSTYATAYALLSRSVHSSAGDLEDHLSLDASSKAIVGFRYGPSDIETIRTVALAGMSLAEVLGQIGKDFEDDRSPTSDRFQKSFEECLKAGH